MGIRPAREEDLEEVPQDRGGELPLPLAPQGIAEASGGYLPGVRGGGKGPGVHHRHRGVSALPKVLPPHPEPGRLP